MSWFGASKGQEIFYRIGEHAGYTRILGGVTVRNELPVLDDGDHSSYWVFKGEWAHVTKLCKLLRA